MIKENFKSTKVEVNINIYVYSILTRLCNLITITFIMMTTSVIFTPTLIILTLVSYGRKLKQRFVKSSIRNLYNYRF